MDQYNEISFLVVDQIMLWRFPFSCVFFVSSYKHSVIQMYLLRTLLVSDVHPSGLELCSTLKKQAVISFKQLEFWSLANHQQ